MTSRTPIGVQPWAPQRSLSSSSLSAHRQQQPSPAHRDTFPDLGSSVSDAGSAPGDLTPRGHGTAARGPGSRLRLEMSNEAMFAVMPTSATNSPQSLTPSRMAPVSADSTSVASTSSPAMSTSQHDPDNPPMPMPRRRQPPSQFVPSQRALSQPQPQTVKKDGRPKPYTAEVPPTAPKYGNKSDANKGEHPAARGEPISRDPFSKGLYSGYADFFPWDGNHHEDEWGSDAIQKGTWDKGNQSETSSARMAIFPALKQKSGLTALSTIFMGVLNQRRNKGQVTATSTFKPPPRVTLTDTKREVWLKDLANPAISLRRLSRTIPHGIRGRTLLEQCLNKKVPTERAVWLAKCVGANEIRAFKRKGATGAFVMGGELKWVRDWTVFVEQFLEAVVSSFGTPDWKAKVTYAIRLATNLYSSHLLDRDHYLDWMVSSTEHSPLSKLPMWLLIAQIYWADLLRTRRFGRRLVYSLSSHLHNIHNDPDGDVYSQLTNRLSFLLAALVKTNPESFVHPPSWLKYRDTIRAFLPIRDEDCQAAFHHISHRNSRLSIGTSASSPAGRQQLVKLLDSSLRQSSDRVLSAQCWTSTDDKTDLVTTLADWATSSHRPGISRIYKAANLIRSWSHFGCAPTTAILDLVDQVNTKDASRKDLVYRLVTELVRTRHFSVPQYLQWLIARGGYHSESEIDPVEGPCATRLLVELPTHCLTDRWKADRGNLLRRAGSYSIEAEDNDMSTAVKCVNYALGWPLPENDPMSQRKPMSIRKLLQRLKLSSLAVQSQVGAHIRDTVAVQLPDDISVPFLVSVRTILEGTQDYSMLAGVLQICTKSANSDVLAVCADTLHANLPVFLALDAADEMFDALIERLKFVNGEQGVGVRPLLDSMASLAHQMPQREALAKQLQKDLLESARSSAIDACSPVSDSNIATGGQNGNGEVSEEIDKLLASGNTIDHPTMNRLFRHIIPKLEGGWAKGDDSRRVFASLLARLRIFDTHHFDKIVSDWLSHVRTLEQRNSLLSLFPLLVSVGCLTMSTLLHTANSSPVTLNPAKTNSAQPVGSSIYCQELLSLILTKLPSSELLSDDETYRFRTHQQSVEFDDAKGLVTLIRNSFIEYAALKSQGLDNSLPFGAAECQDAVLTTMRSLVVADSTLVADVLDIDKLPADALELAHKVFSKLLVPGDDDSTQTSFDRILGLANGLTLPFCQLKLNLDLSLARKKSADSAAEEEVSQFDLFAKAMDRAIEARNIMWTSMLPSLSDEITQHLKGLAHSRFLDLLPSIKSSSSEDDVASADRIHLAENHLSVLEAIVSAQTQSKSAQLNMELADKLSELWEMMGARAETDNEAQAAILQHWLPALLRFINLHGAATDSHSAVAPNVPAAGATKAAGTPHEPRARIILILCSIFLDLQSMPQHLTASLTQHVLDVAILLVDALPDELRTTCAKVILLTPGTSVTTNTSPTLISATTLSSDPRLHYLLSASQVSPASNLMLAHRDNKSTNLHSPAARGMGAMYGIGPAAQERLTPFMLKRWELLSEPTPNVGENDTSLSLGLFEAIKIQ